LWFEGHFLNPGGLKPLIFGGGVDAGLKASSTESGERGGGSRWAESTNGIVVRAGGSCLRLKPVKIARVNAGLEGQLYRVGL